MSLKEPADTRRAQERHVSEIEPNRVQATTQFIGDSTGEFVAGFGIEAAGACEHYRIVVLGACNREIHHVARWLRASMRKKPPVAGHSHRPESVSSTTTTRHAAN